MRSCSRSAAGVCATVRAGFAEGAAPGDAVWKRLISPQPASASAAHSRTGAAKPRRLHKIPRRRKRRFTVVICLCPAGLVFAGQFDLSHPQRFYARSAARLDKTADANSLVFEGLERDSRSLESRQCAL